jgi:hypothetical protein
MSAKKLNKIETEPVSGVFVIKLMKMIEATHS